MYVFRLAVVATLFSLFTFHFSLSPAFAQSNGVSVTPSIIKLDLQEDKPEFILYYKNTTDGPIQLRFKSQDFTDLEDGWKVNFLDEKDAKNYSYSLTTWLDFERQTLDLDAGEERQLKVRIDKDYLTPGGHYASILAEITQTDPNKKETVSVTGILSSLVFVRTNTGKEIESGQIQTFGISKGNFLSVPTEFVFRLHNTGNTDLTPYGTVEVKDTFNRTVAKGIINEGSLITLPETVRRYDVEVKNSEKKSVIWPGFYKAQLTLNVGKNNDRTLKKDLLIPVAGSPFIQLGIIIILATAIAAGIFLFKKRRSKRKVQPEEKEPEKKEDLKTGYTKGKATRKAKKI